MALSPRGSPPETFPSSTEWVPPWACAVETTGRLFVPSIVHPLRLPDSKSNACVEPAVAPVHPLASVTVRVYVVVAEGLAIGVQLEASSRPAAGDQEQETPPEPVSCVEAPLQIVAVPDAFAVGGAQTVTVTVAELTDVQPCASATVSV